MLNFHLDSHLWSFFFLNILIKFVNTHFKFLHLILNVNFFVFHTASYSFWVYLAEAYIEFSHFTYFSKFDFHSQTVFHVMCLNHFEQFLFPIIIMDLSVPINWWIQNLQLLTYWTIFFFCFALIFGVNECKRRTQRQNHDSEYCVPVCKSLIQTTVNPGLNVSCECFVFNPATQLSLYCSFLRVLNLCVCVLVFVYCWCFCHVGCDIN